MVTIPRNGKFAIISLQLPKQISAGLTQLGLDVITPDTLTANKENYNPEFTENVIQELKKEGFVGMNAANLTTHLPYNDKGYYLSDGKIAPVSVRHNLNDKFPVDEFYKENPFRFEYGGGGPHCFTMELKPPVSIKHEEAPFTLLLNA